MSDPRGLSATAPARAPDAPLDLHDRSATLGEHIGRWYERAGGIARAISEAQSAQERRSGVLDGLVWPKWEPSDVTERPARLAGLLHPEMMKDNSKYAGMWQPRNALILRNEDNTYHPQATLEHELSHNAYSRDEKTISKQQQAAASGTHGWALPRAGVDAGQDRERYWTLPSEVDVRLAEIKRRYAHHTGRLVTTPEEAERAWEWWRQNQPALHGKGPVEDRPSLRPDTFQKYDALPGSMRRQMFHRMAELVQADRPLEGLLG